MKSKFPLGPLLLLALFTRLAGPAADAQSPTVSQDQPDMRPVVLPGAECFDLRSRSGIDYRIFVAGPKGDVPAEGAPVIYLTDGNGHFPIVLAAAQRQVRDELPCVVVGIGYATDDPKELRQLRAFDLTPETSQEWAKANARPFSDLKTGGQDQFLEFIESELKPIVERKFKIDRQRQTLFGHSFGGLFVLHVLFTRPESFQNYVAASPSIWWNNESIVQEQVQFQQKYGDQKIAVRLLLTVGQLEQPPANERPATSARPGPPGRAVDSIKAMAESLTSARLEGLVVVTRVFVDEHHGSVILPAASRGVRFALVD